MNVLIADNASEVSITSRCRGGSDSIVSYLNDEFARFNHLAV